MKRTSEPAFSNGTEHIMFLERNCEKCVKYSHYNEKTDTYTQYRCAVQKDIDLQMFSDEPISQRTKDITDNFTLHGILCPNLLTHRKKYASRPKNQLSLF